MTQPVAMGPWMIDASDFPHSASDQDKLRFALRYAILAPSGHNTQPWEFRVSGDVVDVYADARRELPIVDPAGRELMISCGAAVFFLRAALRRFGLAVDTMMLPTSGDPRRVAEVRLAGATEPTAVEIALADAIPRRHTNRRPFEDRPVDAALIAALRDAAAAEGAWLADVSDDAGKRALAGLVAEANRQQFADPAFRGELASWVRDPEAEEGLTHGVPVAEAGERARVLPLRTFEGPAGTPASDEELASGSPLLGVIGTPDDDDRAWMAAGQALGHVLLSASAAGLSASFLNQPIEVASVRPLVCEAIGRSGHPHVLLRLGYGPEVPATPRRPLEDVLVDR